MRKVFFSLILALLFISCNEKIETQYITNVKVVDVRTGKTSADQFIEIQNGTITKIDSMIALSEGIEPLFDGKSMYVTPGLSDMAVYISKQITDLDFWTVHPGDRMLAYGVTTMRDAGFSGKIGALIEHEEKFRGESTIGPSIIRSALANYSSGTNIEKLQKEIAGNDANYIKMDFFISATEKENILTYAEENNLYTCANVFSLEDLESSSQIGLDEIKRISSLMNIFIDEDSQKSISWFNEKECWPQLDEYFSKYYDFSDEELYLMVGEKLSDVVQIIKALDIAITTALSIEEISVLKIHSPGKFEEYSVLHSMPEYRNSMKIINRSVYGDQFRLDAIPEFVRFQSRMDLQILKYLRTQEVMLLSGTELSSRSWYGIAPGVALHDELRILKEAGYSDLEALQTATLNAAKVGEKMNTSYKWGVIEDGYSADIVFTESNPIDDIGVLRNPRAVMKRGRLYTEEELRSLRQ